MTRCFYVSQTDLRGLQVYCTVGSENTDFTFFTLFIVNGI